MKYKIISGITIIMIIIIAIVFENSEVKNNRYHQHLQSPQKQECTHQLDELFCTHLPLISIVSEKEIPYEYLTDENGIDLLGENGNTVQNNEMVSALVSYYDNQTLNNHLSDQPVISENALIRIRGRSSRSFDKKGYYFKFKEDNLTHNKDISLSGMTADSDWILHGPLLDQSLIRNYLCYNISGEIMDYAPNVRFCELFLNGEYMGLYVLTEKIDYNDEGRINISETDDNLNETSYILKLDSGSEDSFYDLNTFSNYTGKSGTPNRLNKRLEIVYPSTTLTNEQKKYIEDEISYFEKTLSSYDSNNKDIGYASYINVESFVEYFIINEFTMNADAGRLSTYYYKDIRGKLNMVVWDFNSAYNNYMVDMSNPHSLMMTDKYWFNYLLKDEQFVDEIIKTYNELRDSYLSDEYLFNYIDETVAYLSDAIDRNNEKWGYLYTTENAMITPFSKNSKDFEDTIENLKAIISERGAYLDENLENLYAHSHPSTNKQFEVQGDRK